MTGDQIRYFQTFGFVLCKGLLSEAETASLSVAFDAAMAKARDGRPPPGPGGRRQQVVPFFDYDPATLYPLVEDDRILDAFEQLLGEDFLFTLSEGILHTGGSSWHHDAYAPDGFFSMRAAIYLDALGPEDGCLTVLPGSQFQEYRDRILGYRQDLGRPGDQPGLHPLVNEPGDVLFMNHKVQHAALSDRPGRRAIHINAVQNTTPERSQEHYDWLIEFLRGETERWGRFYSDRLLRSAGPRLRGILDRAVALGFGDSGPITQLQDR